MVVTSDDPMAASSDLPMKLLIALETMSKYIPLLSFDVWVPANETNKKKFTYRFIARDGRRWIQTMNISTSNTYLTFNVTDQWMLSELEQNKFIRDNIVDCLLRKNKVTKISCNWN